MAASMPTSSEIAMVSNPVAGSADPRFQNWSYTQDPEQAEKILLEASAVLEGEVMRRVANGLSAFPRGRGSTATYRGSHAGHSSRRTLHRAHSGHTQGRGSSSRRTIGTLLPGSSPKTDVGSVLEEAREESKSRDADDPGSMDAGLLKNDDFVGEELDGSLILSMERTLFSALNQSWTLIMVGIGLMSVGAENDKIPDRLGEFVTIVREMMAKRGLEQNNTALLLVCVYCAYDTSRLTHTPSYHFATNSAPFCLP